MILSDDTVSIRHEYGIYRAAPSRKLGIIAKDEHGQYKFYPSGIPLSGQEVKEIDRIVESYLGQ